MFVVALVLGAVLLRSFAAEQLIEENEPAVRSAGQLAEALNAALRSSANPQQTLDAFGQSLGTGGVHSVPQRGSERSGGVSRCDGNQGRAGRPAGSSIFWRCRKWRAAFPVMIDGKRVADIVFDPDMSADIYEKWIGFLAILVSAVALALLTGIIAYVTAGAALAPLRDLGEGLTRLRQGNYGDFITPAGPPEIRRSAEEANHWRKPWSG